MLHHLLPLLLLPFALAHQNQNPIPGQYAPYNTLRGPSPPYPGAERGAILPTSSSPPKPDDELWQNLNQAEWAIAYFYGEAIKRFNVQEFEELRRVFGREGVSGGGVSGGGFNGTQVWDRIQEIRDNEVGHVQITRSMISDSSVKPGPCEYNFNSSTPMEFLIRQTIIEASGPAFLPGLVTVAKEPESQGVLSSLSQIEVRHGTWATMDIFNSNPFTGPADTVYPYPLQILAGTAAFILPASCPPENPPFPNPPQKPAPMTANPPFAKPGEAVTFSFPVPQKQPKFEKGREYYAVWFHALSNITTNFDVVSGRAKVPGEFDKGKGVIVVAISDEPGAGREESVIAGPVLMLQQPDLSNFMPGG